MLAGRGVHPQHSPDQCQLPGAGEAGARTATNAARGHETVPAAHWPEGESHSAPQGSGGAGCFGKVQVA